MDNQKDKANDMPDKVGCCKPPAFQTTLVAFKSGHYKKIKGTWKGDSVWGHFIKPNGKMVHVNKDEIEYMEEM